MALLGCTNFWTAVGGPLREMEPRAGVEPAIKALPTYALPLGDRGKVRVRELAPLARGHKSNNLRLPCCVGASSGE
jgi:hypothetical protein